MKTRLLLIAVLLLACAGQIVPQQPPQPQTQPQQPSVQVGNLYLQNASLREVVDQLARQLQMNIMVDDRVQGSVTLNTYGQGNIDARNLLDLILRINGAGLIQEGPIYRVVPTNELVRQQFTSQSDPNAIPEDDRPMLNLIFLKYVTVDEVSKVLTEFSDQRTLIKSYAPANLLFIMDSRRNMRRLMELIAMFDSDSFAGERIRLFEIKNTVPSELLKDLEKVLKAISLDEKTSTVRFLPVDRIGKLIAVAPNPGVFERVEAWIQNLDVAITEASTLIDTYVYRVNYGRADCLAMALNQLYYPQSGMGNYGGGGGFGGYGNTGAGYGNYGGGGGYNNYGGNFGNVANTGIGTFGNNGGNYGNQNGFNSGFGGGGPCGPYSSMSMGGMGGGYGYPTFGGYAAQTPVAGAPGGGSLIGAAQAGAPVAGGGQAQAAGDAKEGPAPPRIVPNPLDNSLLIQANAQQYQAVLKLLKELDRPPRQILLEAKIYQVVMSGSFAAGVNTYFQNKTGTERRPLAQLGSAGLNLSAGTLVGQARELLSFLQLNETTGNTKVISEPSLIATDSIPAHINVGAQVPVLTGTVTSVGSASPTSLQSIGSRNTGVTLQVNARVNPSGVVTLLVNQEVSAQQGGQSTLTPSFNQQIVQTQLTVQDGDTIAIGGIISESTTNSSAGLPFLHRVPGLGALFGNQSRSNARTELILFMTPHVIFDNTDLVDSSNQLKGEMKHLRRYYVQ